VNQLVAGITDSNDMPSAASSSEYDAADTLPAATHVDDDIVDDAEANDCVADEVQIDIDNDVDDDTDDDDEVQIDIDNDDDTEIETMEAHTPLHTTSSSTTTTATITPASKNHEYDSNNDAIQ